MLQEEVTKIVLRDEGQVLKKAKINELEFGLRPDRKKIGIYRSFSYEEFKRHLNPLAGGNVDLILTGAFSNSLFPVRYSRGFIFESGDPKAGDLIEKYGMDIMGLNQNTFNKIQRDIYAKKLALFIKRQLGLNATTKAASKR